MFSLTEFSVNDPESPKEHWVDMFSFYVQYWTARVNGSPLRRSKCFESHQASHTRPNRTGRSIVSPVSKICLLVGGFVVVQLLKSAVLHVICWSFSVFFRASFSSFQAFQTLMLCQSNGWQEIMFSRELQQQMVQMAHQTWCVKRINWIWGTKMGMCCQVICTKVVVSNGFLISPLLGKIILFDDHIVQMGWFNHQLVIIQ